jgi:hypothetical protein
VCTAIARNWWSPNAEMRGECACARAEIGLCSARTTVFRSDLIVPLGTRCAYAAKCPPDTPVHGKKET